MKGGSRVALELMDKTTEDGLKRMARSRLFWFYSLCLFVPGALKKMAIWLAAAEIGSLAFYLLATPPNLYLWPSATAFLAISGLVWLVYGWGTILRERASPTNVLVRTTLLFKVIRKGKSFEDLSPAELDDLFPEEKHPIANISLERYLSTERFLKHVGLLSIGTMFVFDAIWYSGIANAYVPILASSQPGTINAAWLWLAQFLLFLSPMMAYFPITRRMAQRIRPEDRTRFVTAMKPKEARSLTLFDISLPELINHINGGSAYDYLSSKWLFRHFGFLSWWQEEYHPLPLLLVPFFGYGLYLIVFQTLGSSYGIAGSIFGGLLSLAIAAVSTMALIGLTLLTSRDKRMEAKAIQQMISASSKGGIPLSQIELDHISEVYSEVTTKPPEHQSALREISLWQAAKAPLGALAFIMGLFVLVIVGSYLNHTVVFPPIPWFSLFMIGSGLVVAYNVIKLWRTSVPPEVYAELAMWFALKEIGRNESQSL